MLWSILDGTVSRLAWNGLPVSRAELLLLESSELDMDRRLLWLKGDMKGEEGMLR